MTSVDGLGPGVSEPETPEAARDRRYPVSTSGRFQVWLALSALLIAAGLFGVVRTRLPSDGTAIEPAKPTAGGARIVSLVPRSELRDGDVVIAADGRRLTTADLPPYRVGDRLVYEVRRSQHLVDIVVVIGGYPLRAALVRNWATLLDIVSILAVASYVFTRRPDDRAARVLLVFAGLAACGATSWVFRQEVVNLGSGPGWWAFLGGGVAYVLVWPTMVHFVLVFPEPRPLLCRRPQLVGLIYVVPVALCAARIGAAAVGPTTAARRIGVLASTITTVEYVVPVLVVWGLVDAHRRADAPGRQRLGLVMATLAACALLDLALWSLPTTITGHPLVPARLHPLVFLPCPLALAVAVLRRQLFDIDVVIRRSLVFASLTASLVAVYVLTVGLLSRLFEHGRGWAPLVATGVVAAVFSPLHQRLQRAITHLVYGYRDDPFAIIARLGQRLEELASPDDVLPMVADTLARSLRLPYVAIELSYADGVEEAARYGQLRGTPLSLPLVFRGETLGRLVVGERTAGEPFSRAESRGLADLARQAGVAAHAVRLTRELQRSRERLVTAREEERRRLRRDLHDGLAPSLAAAALELQTVRRLTRTDPQAAENLSGRVAEEIRAAVGDIRTLVYDLRPPALDQLGLVSALRERADSLAASDGGRSFTVTVEAEGDFAELPAAVEVAAFRIACEALHNASRHSGAGSCSLRLIADGALKLEVADDGCGLTSDHRVGVGLASMRERAAELGGSCRVENRPSGGTLVRACLPLERK